MRKGTWIGSLAVVLGLGYVAGVYVTSEQVKVEYARYVSVLSENYRGTAKISSTTQASFFNTSNTLVMEFENLPEPVLEWANTNTISFDMNFSHGFLVSDSVTTITKGELLEKIKAHQQQDREPLIATASFKYDLIDRKVKVQGMVDLDGFKYADDVLELSVGSSKGPYTIEGDRFDFELDSQASQLKVEDVLFNLGSSRFVQNSVALNGDILTADMAVNSQAKVDVEKFAVSGPTGDLLLDTLTLKVEQHIKDDRAIVTANYQAKLLKTSNGQEQYQFDNPQLDMMIDLDFASLVGFVKGLKDLQQSGSGGIENPMDMLPLLNGITGKGLGLDINRLEFAYDGEKLEGNAGLKLAPFAIEEFMQNRQAAIEKADLKASFVLPKKLLEVIPGYDPGQLGFAVAMGFLVDDEKSYRFDLKAEQGKIVLNGKPLPGM